MKRGRGKQKGNKWERLACRMLSLWWTSSKSDDIFWRSTSSGARATSRRRKGRATVNSEGDVAALDAIGQPLLDLCVVELKRGYNRFSPFDCLDRPKTGAQAKWDEWIQQAVEGAEFSATFAWIVIARRDKREAVVVMPYRLVRALRAAGEWDGGLEPFVKMLVPVRFKSLGPVTYTDRMMMLAAMTFEQFLEVAPSTIKELSRSL